MILTGIGGKQFNLENTPFAQGGEGLVYNIIGMPDKVAKIYKSGLATVQREKKLHIMVTNPPDQSVLSQIAWPLDVLYENNKFMGFVMPKLKINEELNVMYEYGSFAKFPNIPWKNKITIAKNLCAVLDAIHKAGHVCGDLNPKNISVNPTNGHIVFVDTDSYHIEDSGNIYRCEVGMPGYLPVEIQTKMKDGLSKAPLPTFSKDADNFALAIHIFQLLMNGVHPFACAVLPSQASVAFPQPSENIVKGQIPFLMNVKGITIPKFAPKIDILTPEIQNLFKKAFVDGHKNPSARPDTELWHKALSNLENNLKKCSVHSFHEYYNKLGNCPWCEADSNFSSGVNKASTLSQSTIRTPISTGTNRSSSTTPSSYTYNKPVSTPSYSTKSTTSDFDGVTFFILLFVFFPAALIYLFVKVNKSTRRWFLIFTSTVIVLILTFSVIIPYFKNQSAFFEEISNGEQLSKLNGSSKNYKLTEDIYLSSVKSWTPIDEFKGILDGQGHKIVGLSIENSIEANLGFFNNLKGTVKNIEFRDVYISAKYDAGTIGTVAAINSGSIENVIVSGIINASGYSYVGGIAGISNSQISNLTSNVKIMGNSYVGGIVGELKLNSNANEITVSTLINTGSVSGQGEYIGGIIGTSTFSNLTLTSVTNEGTIFGYEKVGGIAGGGALQINKSYARGSVSGSRYVGGVVGYSSGIIQQLNNESSVSGKVCVGGVVGYSTNEIRYVENRGNVVSTGFEYDSALDLNFSALGGIAGYANKVSDSENFSDIYNNQTGECVGGIIGISVGITENNTNHGNIFSLGNKVGGIIGIKWSRVYEAAHYASKVQALYPEYFQRNQNKGNVTGKNGVGGVVGYVHYEGRRKGTEIDIYGNSNGGNISGDFYVGGIVGYFDNTAQYRNIGVGLQIYGDYYINTTFRSNENNGDVIAKYDFSAGILGYVRGGITSEKTQSKVFIRMNGNTGIVSGREYIQEICNYGNYVYFE